MVGSEGQGFIREVISVLEKLLFFSLQSDVLCQFKSSEKKTLRQYHGSKDLLSVTSVKDKETGTERGRESLQVLM